MTLDPRHVAVFKAVMLHGSFTGAARELGYSQPAISQQMKALEKALGTPIFIRSGRGLLLTEAGRMLEAHADPILQGLARAEARVRAVVEMRSGTVRICTFPSASATLVPAMFSRLRALYPDIRIVLSESEPPASFEQLSAGECDLALAFTFGVADEPVEEAFLRVPLIRDPLVVLLHAGHPLAGAASLDLRDLADEPWIAGCPRCNVHFHQICAEAGFDPDVVCATDDNLSVQSLVASGLGAALMPNLVVSFTRHANIVAVPLSLPPTRTISAYTWTRSTEIPIVRECLEVLQEVAGYFATHRGGGAPAGITA